jgi:lysophospholipase L1-like esterase
MHAYDDIGHLRLKNICQRYPYGQLDEQRPVEQRSYKPETPQWELCTNSSGWRGPDFRIEKPSNVFRIVCMGDSSTMGMGVSYDKTYCHLFGTTLGPVLREQGLYVETLNAGVWGHSSYQGLIAYSKFIKDWRADLIIVAYGGSDRAPLATYRHRFPDRLAFSLPGADNSRSVASDVMANSRAVRLIKYLILSLVERYHSAFGSKNAEQGGSIRLLERRSTPSEYGENLSLLIGRIRQQGAVVAVLGIGIQEQEYRLVARKVALEKEVNFISTWDAMAAMAPEVRLGDHYRGDKEEMARWFTEKAWSHTGAQSRYLTIDGAHPTQIGHKIIAQQLYDIMNAENTARIRRSLKAHQ